MHENRISLLATQAVSLYRLHINSLFAQQGIDLTSEMYSVLRELWKKDGQKQQDLAGLLYKDKSSITKIVDNLEKRKLVTRVTDENDRRNKQITLTREGQALKKKVLPLVNDLLQRSTAHISQSKMEQARQVLETIIQRLS